MDSYDPINGWDPYGTNVRDFDWRAFWNGLKNIKAEDLNPAKEMLVSGYDLFGDEAHKNRLNTKRQYEKFGDYLAPNQTFECGVGCNITMGARFAFSIFETVGTAVSGAGALEAGIKASSRNRLSNAVKESVEESADAAAKAERKIASGAGKGGGGKGAGGCTGGSCPLGSGSCFEEGTVVDTPDGKKAIEDLEVGDWVWAHDFGSDQKVARRVKHLIPGKTDAWVHLLTDKGEIVATPGHDFWVQSEGRWIDAINLKPEISLLTSDGKIAYIISLEVERLEVEEQTYNFEVEEDHNYYVGDSALLVHNVGCGEAGEAFENSVKNTFRKKIVKENEKIVDGSGVELAEIDFETHAAIVEVGISLKKKLPQLHKLANIAQRRGKRLDIIYGPKTPRGRIDKFKSSLRKKFGSRVRFIPHDD